MPTASTHISDRIALLADLHRPVDAYLHAAPNCLDDKHDIFEGIDDGTWYCVTCTLADGGPTKVCAICRDIDGHRAAWPTITDDLISAARDEETAGDDELQMKSLGIHDGKTELEVATTGYLDDGLGVLLDHMGDMLDAHKADNYVEFELIRRHKRPINVCVRWLHHPTPHELRRTAEAERDRALATIHRLRTNISDLMTQAFRADETGNHGRNDSAEHAAAIASAAMIDALASAGPEAQS